jgi:poly(3-hydroxybutyrate) depolymerase
MWRIPLCSFFAGVSILSAESSGPDTLEQWLNVPRESRPALQKQAFASVNLDKAAAEKARALLWQEHSQWIRNQRRAEMEAKVIVMGDQAMKFEMQSVSRADHPKEKGRSLFISLHGGGNAPAAVNESQWRNQVALFKAYRPQEGIYVAPRAPTNTWNLWHEAHIDRLFDRLIQNLIVLEQVNPNRVYVLGYSAGGDGVYQLAPRMSDRWAAAAMMAGHPNETQADGLRNVPFALQVGELDADFKRNTVAKEFGRKLESLRKADSEGYEHFVEIHSGKGHWMETEDRKAIAWMEKFTRNPYPEKLVWVQDDVLHARSYWLGVELAQVKAGQVIRAERKGQKISLQGDAGLSCSVYLNDQMVNLDQPIQVLGNGKLIFTRKVDRSCGMMERTLRERGDPDLIFSAEVKLRLP